MNKVKKIAVVVLSLAALLFWIVPSAGVKAQLPAQIELACPSGQSPLPGGSTLNTSTGKYRQNFCVDANGNVTLAISSSSTFGGSSPVTVSGNGTTTQVLHGNAGGPPFAFGAVNLATDVSGTLPGANMTAINLAASGNGGVTGALPVANMGSGAPASGKYLDGGGSWTILPLGGVTESTFGWGGATFTPGAGAAACSINASPWCVKTVFAKAHTLVRVSYVLTTFPSGCTTNLVVGVFDVTSSTLLGSITVSQSSTGYFDSGALSVATTAGDQIGVGLTTAPSGCTTFASLYGLTAVFQ